MATNQITGTQGNDILVDTNLEDEILALAGDDEISAGVNFDVVDGGSGYDILNLDFFNSVNGVCSGFIL